MKTSVVIRGIGLVTPIGGCAHSTWRALLAGQTIGFHSRAQLESLMTGSGRLVRLARVALDECARASQWNLDQIRNDRTALVVGTSKGSIDDCLTAPPPAYPTSDNPAGAHKFQFGLADLAAQLAEIFKPGGARETISTACSTGINALIRGALLIQQGDADRVMVVAAESSFHPLLLASYERLGVLVRPGQRVRPFDSRRSGFLVGEAAAAICLESSAPRSGDLVIDGLAFGSDASHLTSTDPEAMTLRRCLRQCIGNDPVQLVHAHGTGTVVNDAAELSAIEATIGNGRPNLFSHKAAIGHTLGVAGLVAAVLNTLMHREGVIPPNANTTQPIETQAVEISPTMTRRCVERSILIAAGFGGTTAVIGLRTA